MNSKLILYLSPVAVWLLWLLWPTVRGRRIGRPRLTVGLSLLVLVYFLAVVGTGIFWVAAQELPVFDWHYVAGYILVLLTLTHVILHWHTVTMFLRREAPLTLVEPGRVRFRRVIRVAAWSVLAVAAGTVVFFLGARAGSVRVIYSGAQASAVAMKPVAGVLVPPAILEEGARSMPLARFYHEGSSYPARVRLPGLTIKARPEVYNTFPGDVIRLPTFQDPDTAQVFSLCEAWRAGRMSADTAAISMEEIAEMLYCAAGITKTISLGTRTFDLRAAPSAGALYPINVYVVVWHVRGLEPGIYYYHPKDASLIRVREDDSALWNLFSASGNPGAWGQPEMAVVLTGTFSRTAFKYAERAYRYVCMDAGHVAGNLALAASAHGWRVPLIARFDDQAVNSVLGLDSSVEAALLLMPVTRGTDQVIEPRFARDASTAAGATFVNLIHGGTSLRRAGAEGEYKARPAVAVPSQPGDVVLPPPATGQGLVAAIRQRRSVREHTASPITAAELSSLCLAADGERAGVAPSEPLLADTAPLSLYVVVRDVTGMDAGVYRYLPATHALRMIRPGDLSQSCMQACLQQEFCGTADAVFVKTVRWDELFIPDGDRGYRYAHLRAGVVGEGLYLQGSSLGIGACGVGAFGDPDVAEVLGLDLDAEVPLYVTAMGR
jgi:SagB-type dehydrogenase family enzyme